MGGNTSMEEVTGHDRKERLDPELYDALAIAFPLPEACHDGQFS